MKITLYDARGQLVITIDTSAIGGDAQIRIEHGDAAVHVRQLDDRLHFSGMKNAVLVDAATHVLWSGRPLCGIAGAPSSWPPNHRWVSLTDERVEETVSCPCCKERLPAAIDELRRSR